ncbi:MAG: hypothetical protein JO154_04575 [Chitinophaga sp.]|uniref:NB-ARC domain-containing protein n=1 Tax=Chitinophaga sp. TaxID=1869181 RepID=UPI0025C0CFC4|nr:NB-ARC domain-containing protein [Chitinophaga sp.]MBV8251862.1 hypothetical protein [Chitinophaga sp.]
MNYILNQLNRKINLLLSQDKKTELKTHLQAKLEFYLVFILGYLWNKNLDKLEEEKKAEVINAILKPSIGSIVAVSRNLDLKSEIFGNKKLRKLIEAIERYPNLRNEQIGHGFSFEDDIDNYITKFTEILSQFEETDICQILKENDLVIVSSLRNGVYNGIIFKANGSDYNVWSCPKEVCDFKLDSLYVKLSDNLYGRLTPFIVIDNENDFFTFCSIEEKLTGRVVYNQLIRTGRKKIECSELASINIVEDGFKRRTSNGTIINNYTKNYKKYIDLSVSNQIINFLTKNNSTVFATLWGHGGIGKTAAIQNTCEILSNQEFKKFDYIIFLSAKDRYYNYYRGIIQEIKGNINTLNEIIEFINRLMFDTVDTSEELIINYQGRVLIVIDDFETFSKDEKNKITSFIQRLNINSHKVILTTRSATLITGLEIETNELDESKTIEFLIKASKNEFPDLNIDKDIKVFRKYSKTIHAITSGRPLFILQFLIMYALKGSINEALLIDIKSLDEAKKFLYDRIYDYLSLDAKNMFLGINLLVNSDDLTGVIENLKFILNKEDNEELFDNSLNELIKLRIIERIDNDLFKVYSPEILKLMRVYYENKGREYDGDITNRFNLIKSGEKLETDYALLKIADSKRIDSSESEVENQYRRIIKRESAKIEVRLKALLNYANYLFTQKGRIDKAIKLFKDYWHWFKAQPDFNIMNARYHWAEGSSQFRYKAVEILDNYLGTKPKIAEEIYLEILGTHMVYASNILVTERNELKDRKRFNEINDRNYRWMYNDQRDRFNKLFNYPGSRLFDLIRNRDLMTLSPKCRTFVLDGLTSHVEVCIRLNKHEVAKEVCFKVLDQMPADYHKPFEFKMNKIDNILENDGESDQKSARKPKATLLGLRLSEALYKRNES